MGSLPKKSQTDTDNFWQAVEDDLSSRPLGETGEADQRGSGYERLAGFNLARRVQGLLIEHGFQPFKIDVVKLARNLRKYVERYCDDVDPDYTIESMVDCWEGIKSPEGFAPVWYAAQKAKTQTRPAPGSYPTDKQANRATYLWHLLGCLPEESEGVVFVDYRNIELATGINKNAVGDTVHALERNKLIQTVFKGRTGKSSRYRILVHPGQMS